jgi:formylglycine-generating enzyme required for sulfatase activity
MRPDAGTVPVESMPQCVGAYAGVFDLAGNVEEWIDSCVGDGGADDPCSEFGSSYISTRSNPPGQCAGNTVDTDGRNVPHPDTGIRCCAP